jgi:hypothetical protein
MIGVVADHPAAASPRVVSGMAGHPQLLQIPAAATSSTARASQIHGICDASIPRLDQDDLEQLTQGQSSHPGDGGGGPAGLCGPDDGRGLRLASSWVGSALNTRLAWS